MEIKSYLSVFRTTEEYEEFKSSADFIVPNITLCDDTKIIHYETDDYFTILNISSEDVKIQLKQNVTAQIINYKLSTSDKWVSASNLLTLPAYESMKIKANFTPNDEYGIGTFTISGGTCNLLGNIMSLLYGDNFRKQSSLSGKNSAFKNLFKNCKTIKDSYQLTLPSTILSSQCYASMFEGCTSLTTCPQLPATTLANSCYNSMFNGCTNLTRIYTLPATTLADSCYKSMLYGCYKLTEAPALPAKTLANSCYESMFFGCTSLTSTPSLPATTLTEYCYSNMFQSCTNLTTASTLPATTLAKRCYSNMFAGCSSLTSAPSLLATKLAEYCYYNMFAGCSSLVTAPTLPATTLANNCYEGMFKSCSNLNKITMLAMTTNNATDCFYEWVAGVASSGTFIKQPFFDFGTSDSTSSIPNGWTIQKYIDSSKVPYIIYAFDYNENEQVSFTYNGGVWTPSKDIIDLNSKFSETNVLQFVPNKQLVVDLYLQGQSNENITWTNNQTFKEFILAIRGSVDNSVIMKSAIFIKQVKEPIGGSYYYYY